jgi:hypothetical protein
LLGGRCILLRCDDDVGVLDDEVVVVAKVEF